MDISPIISSSIVQTDFFGTASVQPVTFLLNPSATTATNSVDTVDISGLGQLLSSSLIFETNILKAAAANQISFPTVVSATQFFVDAFNSFLQSSSLQSSSGGSLGNLFTTMLNTHTTSSADGRSIIASLSGIGINFQASTSQNSPGLMTIDLQTLQSAFNADQLGTVSVLAQATQSIGQVATEATSLFVQTNDLTQNSQSSLNAATSNGLLEATGTTVATGATAATGTTVATAATGTTAATGATVATATTGTTAATAETNAAAPITVRLPVTTTLPTASVPVTAAPAATAPAVTPQNLFNPIIDSSDPAVAAAIAAYHVIDGIFNSSKPHIEASSAFVPGYSNIPPVARIQPVRLDLYA